MRYTRHQNGFVSLIAVTLASFLILILTLGMSALMVGELRQAEDNENNVKAYYAAESNAELAVLKVKDLLNAGDPPALQGLDGSSDCNGELVPPLPVLEPSLQVTSCSLQTYGEPYNGTMSESTNTDTLQFGLGAAPSNIQSFTLQIDPSGSGTPYIEATMDYYKRTGGATGYVAAATPSTQYICPNNSNAGGGTSTVCTSGNRNTGSFNQPAGYNVTTRLSGDTITLNNLYPDPSYTGILRLRIFGGTAAISLTPLDGSGGKQPILFPNAVINVTAQAGDSFSGVQEITPIVSETPDNTDVLSGDAGLCKNFTIITGASGTPLQTTGGSDTCNSGP
jgi:hypothetical protein